MIFIPKNFSDNSKVWVYQSDRKLNSKEVTHLKEQVQNFVQNWISHNNQLKAFGDIYLDQIIILMVDESNASASGCSIDTSVAFIKQMGHKYDIDFFNRWNFLILNSQQNVQLISKDELQDLFQKGRIDLDTLFVDSLVKTLAEFKIGFIKPLRDSWHKNFLNV
jgi:hypothetical protein